MESDYIFREELLGDWLGNKEKFSCKVDMTGDKKYLISVFGIMDSPGSRSSETRVIVPILRPYLFNVQDNTILIVPRLLRSL